jgi:hypothetical protein
MLSEVQGVLAPGKATIWEDNHRTIAYSHDALVNDKTKYIGIKYCYFVKDHVAQGIIRLLYLPTSERVADILIKPMLGPALSKHTAVMMGAT